MLSHTVFHRQSIPMTITKLPASIKCYLDPALIYIVLITIKSDSSSLVKVLSVYKQNPPIGTDKRSPSMLAMERLPFGQPFFTPMPVNSIESSRVGFPAPLCLTSPMVHSTYIQSSSRYGNRPDSTSVKGTSNTTSISRTPPPYETELLSSEGVHDVYSPRMATTILPSPTRHNHSHEGSMLCTTCCTDATKPASNFSGSNRSASSSPRDLAASPPGSCKSFVFSFSTPKIIVRQVMIS